MILTPASTIESVLGSTARAPDDLATALNKPDKLFATAETCLAQHRQLQFEVTRYIDMLLGELATMAKAADLTPLVQSLEETRLQAGAAMRRHRSEP